MELLGQELGGRYRLIRPIGQGGMGTVYEAVQTDLQRHVAVKVLSNAGDERARGRFRREAMAAASLVHPNVVCVTDYQVPAVGDPFLVMEFVDAPSLRAVLVREGRLAPRRAVLLTVQVLAGVAAAHARGIVHRDLKPSNVLVAGGGPLGELAKVCDFGVAKVAVDDGIPRTTLGTMVGTVTYMPPEQIRGDAIDARTDVYAIGVCLFEMLSGQRPYNGPSAVDVAAAICLHPPPVLGSLVPDLPPGLAAVVHRAMAKDPAERFPSAQAFADALAPFAETTQAPYPPPAFATPPLPPIAEPRRTNVALWLATAAATLAVGGVVLLAGIVASQRLTNANAQPPAPGATFVTADPTETPPAAPTAPSPSASAVASTSTPLPQPTASASAVAPAAPAPPAARLVRHVKTRCGTHEFAHGVPSAEADRAAEMFRANCAAMSAAMTACYKNVVFEERYQRDVVVTTLDVHGAIRSVRTKMDQIQKKDRVLNAAAAACAEGVVRRQPFSKWASDDNSVTLDVVLDQEP